jgi:peroxiredoxin Q/BCP
MAAPGVGDRAPAFSLAGTGGLTYELSSCLGGAVVLVFYPGDGTPVCTRQLCSYSAERSAFDAKGATLWAISPQSVASHDSFAASSSLSMPLLADVDRSVGRAYGVVGPVGFYRRSVFVVDPEGVIAYAHRGYVGLTFLPSSELLGALDEAAAEG